ncbi:GNAT family N-acetyltransferase [Alicyclobacillus tolerans]|uniref:GNAT family N-acetyltransferase n=1 Tax=Alicyclobacillus tolerans TaxID=90970 RepID=UPI003B81108F
MGYFLGKDYKGKGIITTSVRALLDYIFDVLILNRVVTQCAAENMKSRAIPDRLGFQQEGIARDGQWLYNRYVDLVNYSLLKRDWLHRH